MMRSTPRQRERLRESGRVLSSVLDEVLKAVRPGVSTGDLDALALRFIEEKGGIAIFKGYGSVGKKRGFPGAVCVSINDEVVHGIPSTQRFVREGDLLKVDIGIRYKGFVTDMARTVCVGTVSPVAKRLVEATAKSLEEGIRAIRPGGRLRDYSGAVQQYVEPLGFSVVRDLVGHGVGNELHEEPQIPNYVDERMLNFVWQEGMVVALEPMINEGSWKVRLDADGWTIRTLDKSLSAHFEDTILVTDDGPEIITRIG